MTVQVMAVTSRRVHEVIQVPSYLSTAAGIQDSMFELADIQYGCITRDVSEALCSTPGDYMIRHGSTNGDFKLTIHQYPSGYSHFNIYRERHPFSRCPFIYFLDDTTRKLMISDLSELVTYVMSHPQSYLTTSIGSNDLVRLQPCTKQKKKVLDNSSITRGCPVNVNTTSSRRYFTGKHNSQKVVLMEKDNYLKVLNEVDARLQLQNHPNILQYMGVTVLQPIYMIFPSEAQHCLHKYIKQLNSSKTDKMIRICIEVCNGLLYIHSRGYLHRSIQARGCVIDNHGVTKILDLSKTCRIEADFVEPEVGELVLVPTRWAAPEVLQHAVFSKSSDVWSFGVFIWEVFNKGKTPYIDIVNDAALITEMKPGFRLSMKKKKHSSFDILLENCLRYDSCGRATADTVYSILQSYTH